MLLLMHISGIECTISDKDNKQHEHDKKSLLFNDVIQEPQNTIKTGLLNWKHKKCHICK